MRNARRIDAGPGWLTKTSALVLALVLVACSSSTGSRGSVTTRPTGPETTVAASTTVVPRPDLLRLRAADGRFMDAGGREVLLRGVNLNFLGDYFQARAEFPQVVPLENSDWDEMAGLGFSVVRLLVSWSALEPQRGSFDERYVDRIRAAVTQAKAHGIYVVLDMHQDAWGKYIATPKGTTCPVGREDNSGWDGAPEWATITDDKSTCRAPGSRESAPAVVTAFDNFYANRDGIQDAFVSTWAKLAAAFANDSTVAGYDLLNEPNVSSALKVIGPQYFALLQHLIAAIRRSETGVHGFDHIIFFEPLLFFPLPGTTPPAGFSKDPNLAFAPHNYWEAITQNVLSIEQGISIDASAAKGWRVPYWIGEYGWFDTTKETVARLKRYASAEDSALASGAWWQWQQACGDPHGLSTSSAIPPSEVVQLRTLGCPGDKSRGFTPAFAAMLSRAHPRAAPGELVEFESDYEHRTMHLSGVARAVTRARLEVWVPRADRAGAPKVTGSGLNDVRVRAVPGGWLVSAGVACHYSLDIDRVTPLEGPAQPCTA